MVGIFSKLFKKKIKSVVGIDIGSSSIKVVQLREKFGHPVLETYGVISLGPYIGEDVGRSVNLPNEKLSSALTEIIKQAKTTTKAGGVAIPFSSSLVSVISLPEVSEEALTTMVPIEARKYIPVPISEVTLDWSVIPKEEDKTDGKVDKGGKRKGKDSKEEKDGEEKKGNIHDPSAPPEKPATLDILIAAIHNNTITKYQNIIQSAPLDANFFEIEIFSAIRSVLGNDEDMSSTVMVIDAGASYTKLYVIEKGIVLNSHTINKGSQDLTLAIARTWNIPFSEAEKKKRNEGLVKNKEIYDAVAPILDFIFVEARSVAESHLRKYGKKVQKAVLIGGGVTAEGFSSIASANLELPVVYGNPFSKIETPDSMKEMLKYNGPEFAVSVGVALRRLEEES